MSSIDQLYAGTLRVRACALIVKDQSLLLIKHHSPARKNPVWLVPGGGVNTGETTEKALQREVHEETGLDISVGELMYVHEFLEDPLHAIELYFKCQIEKGEPVLGRDPELKMKDQIMTEIRFINLNRLTEYPVYPKYIAAHISDHIHEKIRVRHFVSD